MNTRISNAIGLSLAVGAFLWANGACAGEHGAGIAEDDQAGENATAITAEAVTAGVQSGRGKGSWTDLGPITVRPRGSKANLTLARFNPNDQGGASEEMESRRKVFIVDDLRTKRRYRVEYDWSSILTPEQLEGPRADVSNEEMDPRAEKLESSAAKGWSNGTDSRSLRDVAGWGTSFNPYNRFAFVGTGCSGTIIRQTLNGTFAMTAAHCMYDNAGNPIATTVQPRRDNATLPYGTWDVIVIHRYDYWVNNQCYFGSSQTDDCRRYDIVLLELSPRAGATYPGGMTYGSYSTSTISNNTKYHRGYPGCGIGGSPVNCVSATLYGDSTHSVTNFRRGDRLFDHSSDTNGGHSGGPMYFYESDDAKFYGVNSGSYCTGAACATLYTSISVRISSDWFDYVYDQLHN